MIGRVNADLELRLRLAVRAASGQRHEVKELIDTGFDDFLTMPPALIAALGLRWLCRQQGELADGSVVAFDVYMAMVDWDGQPRNAEVAGTDL